MLQAEAIAQEPLTIPIVPIILRYQPKPTWRATAFINICPPLFAADFRQESDKQTAEVLTEALQAAILKGLEKINAHTPIEN